MRIIHLKTKHKNFKQHLKGLKQYEIRTNDNDYKPGDILCLEEYKKNEYTGKYIHLEVLAIDNNKHLKNGYICMSTKLRLDLGMKSI